MTNKQRDCYAEMRDGKRPNTMDEHDKIAKEALIAGKADPAYADQLVTQSRQQLDGKGVTSPRPWKK
jgi:hypothetical protein